MPIALEEPIKPELLRVGEGEIQGKNLLINKLGKCINPQSSIMFKGQILIATT
jgi:hypothetical protein